MTTRVARKETWYKRQSHDIERDESTICHCTTATPRREFSGISIF
jgi:hypothetical protein